MTLPAPPCPNCGCESCLIFSDAFGTDQLATAYEVRSGTWAVTGGKLDPSASGLILVDTAMPGGMETLCYKVKATCNTTSDIARLVFLYTDDDNYWFIEAQPGTTDGTLRLYERVSGTNTQHDTDTTIIDFSAGQTVNLQACVYAGIIRATAYQTISEIADVIYTGPPAVAGTKCGLDATVSSDVKFDDLFIGRHQIESPCTCTCPESTPQTCGDACSDSTSKLGVVLTGVTGGPAGCAFEDGTYIFTRGQTTPDCLYGTTHGCPCPAFCLAVGVILELTDETTSVGATLDWYETLSSIVVFASSDVGIGAPDANCRNIEGATLTYSSGGGACCDYTGASVEVSHL